MAKKKRCATCEADLDGKNYHFMWDEKTRKTVCVCFQKPKCQEPYLKGVKVG